MPNMGMWSWISWVAIVAGQLAAAGMLLCTGKWDKFPSLFAFLCWRSLVSLILLGITLAFPSDALYFWFYYFGVIVGCVLSAVLIVNILTYFVDSIELQRSIRTVLFAMGFACLAGSICLASSSSLPFDERVVRLCVILTRAGSMAWLALFLCAMFLVRKFRLSWPERALGIAIGYALEAIGVVSHDWLLGLIRTQTLSDMRSVFYLACLTTWIVTLRKPTREPACAVPNFALKGQLL